MVAGRGREAGSTDVGVGGAWLQGGLAKTVNAATMPVLAATYVDEVQYMAATGWH